jgi:hypothetical protein
VFAVPFTTPRYPWTLTDPGAPAAFTIPHATLPTETYIRGPRYQVRFDRIVTPRFTRADNRDLRRLVNNAVSDLRAESDARDIRALEAVIG